MEDYYAKQAGNGLASYSGVRYQRGNGFFGRLINGSVLPFLRYFGKKALSTGADVAEDLLDGGDLKTVAKKHLNTQARSIAKDAIEKVRGIAQQGQGFKRKSGFPACSTKKPKRVKKTPKKLKAKKAKSKRAKPKAKSTKTAPKTIKGTTPKPKATKKLTKAPKTIKGGKVLAKAYSQFLL